MTQKNLKNRAASVHQRIMNVAQTRKRPFNELLQLYAIVRFLYRLSLSSHKDRFILKGGLTMLVWNSSMTRPTRDIDLLGKISNDLDLVRDIVTQICQQKVEDDGMTFDPATITTQRIVEDADYHGVRAQFTALLGNARVPMQIDMGFSDVITPRPIQISYPTILSDPAVSLLAYNPETSIAEKFEAMVSLGQLNSRMKDFYDIWALSSTLEFKGKELAEAIAKTFENRKTEITESPLCFSDSFAADKSKEVQWTAFIRNALMSHAPVSFVEVIAAVRVFLQPIVSAIASKVVFSLVWNPSTRTWK